MTVTGSSGSVSLQTSVTPAAKQKVELPFGLQHAKTKRKRKPRNPPTKPRARAKARGHGRGRGGRGRRQVASSSSSSSSSSSDSSSQSDPSRDDSALSSDSDEDRRPAEYADDDEAEAIAMPNAAAVDEAAVLREAEVELRADHLRRQQLAETHVRGGTYFVRQIGFDEGSVAPTCRSVCYVAKRLRKVPADFHISGTKEGHPGTCMQHVWCILLMQILLPPMPEKFRLWKQ